jgi:putative acetyltransferase
VHARAVGLEAFALAVRIRDETPRDITVIHDLVAAAFGRDEEARLVDRLRAEGDAAISLVACEGERLVGHILFSPMRAPFRALGLAPVSVLPDRQRAGIGSVLIRAGLARAEAEGWQGVFVLGEPAFYRRFGFDPDLARGFQSPYAGPYLMALPFRGALPATSGSVEYAPAFAAFG